MHNAAEWGGEHPALGALRAQLADGLARAGLDKTQLAVRAGLGRTTVHQAFQVGGPAPSAKTVAALGRALRLPTDELLALLRAAATPPPEAKPVRGRPIAEWDPHDLEVHPAGFAPRVHGGSDAQKLPGYVARDHDRLLAATVQDVLRGGSRMVVLVGSSSTGKTRACWEAVQPLADKGWMLWHPFDPSRAAAALDELHRVGPRTVVWLNESQHYLGDQRAGEEIAAALHALLIEPARGPVLVLGTLWPEYARQYAARPEPGKPDPHSRVRELLTGRTVTVPDAFDARALAAASVLAEAGDGLLAESLARTVDSGRLAQDLAGAPALLDRYQHGTPAAKALLEAAMDAQRLGHGPSLSYGLLAEGAEGYLPDEEWGLLAEDWLEAGMAYVAAPLTGMRGALVRRRPRARRTPGLAAPSALPQYRLADYLDQHGRHTRQDEPVPATLWQALLTHGDRSGFLALGESAEAPGLLRIAARFYAEADGGAEKLASLLNSCGRQEEARPWWIRSVSENGEGYALGRVVETAPSGTPEEAESILTWWWENVPKDRAQGTHLSTLIRRLGPTDDPKTMMWWRRAAEQGHPEAEAILVDHLRETGGPDAVLTWYRDRCTDNRWYRCKAADLLVELNRPEEAISLLSASDEDDSDAHLRLGRLLLSSGQGEKAVEWLAKAGRNLTGFTGAQAVQELFRIGRDDAALEVLEGLLESTADADDEAVTDAARLLEEAGRHADGADFWRRAAAAKHPSAWVCLQYARSLARSNELPEALVWYQRAVEGGERRFLQAIDQWEAELLASQGKTEADLTQWRLTYAATTHFLGKPLRRWNAPLDEKLTWLFRLTERGHPSAMGYAITRLCDAGREVEALEWALSLAERGHDQAPREVAELYAQAGELDLALQWWERSARDTSYTYGAYRAAGEALRDAGDLKEAVKWFRRATEAGDVDLLWLTVEGYETLERHEEALAWLWQLAVRGWGPCLRLTTDVLERGSREQEAEQLRRYGWEADGSTATAWTAPPPVWPGSIPAIVDPQSAATAR
ncbi:tetratricopeptide repeat protein [Streptomyces sp. NPDC047043]|uniref:tetratricopeptide repeat protein n=1 Tax=Streptomyces sp. NPDC047043 TaxID=3154497 RepID=UPI0033CA9EC3